jgi:hypothetical protein
VRAVAVLGSVTCCAVLAGCGGGTGSRQANPSSLTAVTTVTTSPAAPTGADADYIADLTTSPLDVEAAYVTAHAANLVRFGHGICADLRRGVRGSDEYDHVTDQLVGDPDFDPGLGSSADAESVRRGQAAIVGISIVLAARRFFCPEVPES